MQTSTQAKPPKSSPASSPSSKPKPHRQSSTGGLSFCFKISTLLVLIIAISLSVLLPNETAVWTTKLMIKVGSAYYHLTDPADYKGPSGEFRTMMKIVRLSTSDPNATWDINNYADVAKFRKLLDSPLDLVAPTNVYADYVTLLFQHRNLELEWFSTTELNSQSVLKHVIIWIQGGGFVGSSKERGRLPAAELAKLTGLPVLAFHYLPLPNGTIELMLEEFLEVRRYVTNVRGVSFKNIYYVGSSAGATLALLSVEKQLREAAHVGVPGGIVAFSPWGLEVALKEDMENWPSYQQYKYQDVLLTPKVVSLFQSAYSVHKSYQVLQRLDTKYTGFPPLFITAGDQEPIRDGIVKLAERIKSDGVDVTLKVYPYMPHSFQMFFGYFPEADAALKEAADWIKQKIAV